MAQEDQNQSLIITHAVLAGLTPLIPIPFVDDLVKTYFQRRLARRLAASYGLALSEQDVKTLADDRGGCLSGCLGTMILYPIEKVSRKILFFLEWKRAIDIVSHLYYHGYLLDYCLQNRWIEPAGPRYPVEARRAIDEVLRRLNTSLLERAVGGAFRQSKSAIKGAAHLLQQSLKRVAGKPSEAQVAQAVEEVEREEEREIEGIVARLQAAIATIPSEHFERLRAEMAAALNLARK